MELDAEGFDTYTVEKKVMAANEQSALQIAGAVIGARGPRGNTVLVNATAEVDVYRPSWSVKMTYKGILGNKPFKRRIRTFPDKTRGTITKVGPSGPYAQEIEVNEALVGVTVLYLSNVTPNTATVGQRQSPPRAVPTPISIWRTIANPLETIPSGWVLDALDADELPGSTVCFVQADYVYYPRYKPGSNSFG